MRPTEETLASALGERGYKLTLQRRAVLSAIADSQDYLTPATVHERAKLANPGVGLVTVYRTLKLLSDCGLICRVHQDGQSRSYTLAPSGHHHHMICSGCGAVSDFTDCGLDALERRLSQETGFEIEGHLLEFSVRCLDCQTKDSN